MKHVDIFTDGACSGNPGPGGWGAILRYNGTEKELSGGERQRVYLAMTLAQDTEIVLMDEPMNFLDVKHQLELLELAKKLAAEGRTVVMVIHDIRIAMQEADELVILNGGSLAAAGTPDEILKAGIIKKVFGADIGFVETGAGRRFYYI